MRKLAIHFSILLATLASVAQNKTEENSQKILGDWIFEQFEKTDRSGNMLIVTKTGYVEEVHFVFNPDFTLEVIYNKIKNEKYNWKVNRNKIQISATSDSKNDRIADRFELNFLTACNEVFLEKDELHQGIMLKKK
jgi:hypothetical protein